MAAGSHDRAEADPVPKKAEEPLFGDVIGDVEGRLPFSAVNVGKSKGFSWLDPGMNFRGLLFEGCLSIVCGRPSI